MSQIQSIKYYYNKFDIIRSLSFLVLIFWIPNLYATNTTMVQNLAGKWKFKIGDNREWSKAKFKDDDWQEINVPSPWENEGYNGYDGYGWYRKQFTFNSKYKNNDIYLSLGFIDDVSEIFVNGHLVGQNGSFLPKYETAYNLNVYFHIPKEYLLTDAKNIIAVRVYDKGGVGGIYAGNIGLFVVAHLLPIEISLEGEWKLKTGDNRNWKEPEYNDKKWAQVFVPWAWEMQGFADYDGFAWYRKTFYLDKNLTKDDLVLVLGKIDDIDETYLNGKMIGSTGDLIKIPVTAKMGDEYSTVRGYYINKSDLSLNGKNVIAIRVYDGKQYGGIYEGPVGITTLEKYKEHLNQLYNVKKSFVEKLFGK